MSARSDDEISKSQEGSTPESSPSSSEDELPRASGEFEQLSINAPATPTTAGPEVPISGQIQHTAGQLADSEVAGASQQIPEESVDSIPAETQALSEFTDSVVSETMQHISEPVDSGVSGTIQQISGPVDGGVAGSSQKLCEELVDEPANMNTPSAEDFIGPAMLISSKDYPSAENVSQEDLKPGSSTSLFESNPQNLYFRKFKRGTKIPSSADRTLSSEETPLQTPTGDIKELDDESPSSSDYQNYPLKDVASSFMFGGSYKQPYQPECDSTSPDISETQNQVVPRPDDEADQRSEQSLDELQDVEEQRVESPDATGSGGIQGAARRPTLQRNYDAANAAPQGHQAYLNALMEEAEQRGDQSTSSGIYSTDPDEQSVAGAQAWMDGVYTPRPRVEANPPAPSPRHVRAQTSAQHLANVVSSSDPDSAEDNRKSCIDQSKRSVPIDSEQADKPDASECTLDDAAQQNIPGTSGSVPSRERRLMETDRETSESPRPLQKRMTAASSLEERHAGNLTPKRAPPRKASSLKNLELVRSASQSSYESVDPQSSSSGSFSRGHSEEKSSSEAPESGETAKLASRRVWQKSGILQSMKNQTLSSHESIVDEEADIDGVKVEPKGATASAQPPGKTGDGDIQIQQKDKMDDPIVQYPNEASSSKTSKRSKKGKGSRKGKGGSKGTPKKLQSPESTSAQTSQGTAATTDVSSTSSTPKSIESVKIPPSEEICDNTGNASSSERKVTEDRPKEEALGGSIPEHGSRSPERSRSAPLERSTHNPKNRPDSCDF